ncbi:hypothetical protein G6F43_000155 [Rhizopus delemar]|nr:hypothetical protein G6F43_000155 [Rhizopus delemar]
MSDSDDEYGPITSTWGSQSNTSDPLVSWHSLADPNAKTGPNGLGSGNLHRRGKNFVPISEEQILAQRLNQGSTKKKLVPKETPKKTNSTKKTGTFTKKIESPAISSRPLLKNQVNNSWNSQTLVETPFWENTTATSQISSKYNSQSSTASKNNNRQTNIENRPSVPNTTSMEVTTNEMTRITTEDKEKYTNDKGISKSDWFETNKDNSKNKWANTASTDGWGTLDITSSTSNGWGSVNKNSSEMIGWGIEKNENDTSSAWETSHGNESTNWGELNMNSTLESSKLSTTDWPSDNNNKSTTNDLAEWDQSTTLSNKTKGEFASNGWSKFSQDSSTDSMTPTWLEEQNSPKSNGRSYQFSNPTKKKYSDYRLVSVPKPMNYTRDKDIPIPTQIAPPPPPENAVLITIHVELSDTLKIPVKIRELDEPEQLAKEFAEKNNVNTETVVQALTKLFDSQKTFALKKANRKLRRKYPTSHNTERYPAQEIVYNKHTHTSSKDTFHTPVSTQQAPFARSQYY